MKLNASMKYNISSFLFNADNDLIPVMASNNAPSPFIILANSYYTTFYPYLAFDKEVSSVGWNAGANNGWIQVYTENLIQISKITIECEDTKENNQPTDFTIQFSKDGTNWTTVKTITGETWSSGGDIKTYTFTPMNCRYIKINVTATQGGSSWLLLQDVRFYGVNSNQSIVDAISDCVLWLDATKLSLDNDDEVTSWNDLSPYKNNAVGDTNPPLFKTGIQNGLPGLYFDGINDFLRIPHHSSLNCYPLTIMSVLKFPTLQPYHWLAFKFSRPPENGYELKTRAEGANIGDYYAYTDDDKVWDGTGGGTFIANQGNLLQFFVNENGLNVKIDGGSVHTVAWTGTPGKTTTETDLYLVTEPTFSKFTNIYIYEFCMWNRDLSSQEVSMLNNHFANKWGITLL